MYVRIGYVIVIFIILYLMYIFDICIVYYFVDVVYVRELWIYDLIVFKSLFYNWD